MSIHILKLLPAITLMLTGCCCFDTCGTYCGGPSGGYWPGYDSCCGSYGTCVNDLPTLYGQNSPCPTNYCCSPSTMNTLPPMMPPPGYNPISFGPPTSFQPSHHSSSVCSCQAHDSAGIQNYATDVCPHCHQVERIRETPHKTTWVQKAKTSWSNRFGKKDQACNCTKCRAKAARGCPHCQSRFAQASYLDESFEGEIYDGEVYEGEIYQGDTIDGEIINEGWQSHDSSCPTCQHHMGGQFAEEQVFDNGQFPLMESYPEYDGQEYAPPVPTQQANPERASEPVEDPQSEQPAPGAQLDGQIMPDDSQTQWRPSTPQPYESQQFQHNAASFETSQSSPPKNYRALMVPPDPTHQVNSKTTSTNWKPTTYSKPSHPNTTPRSTTTKTTTSTSPYAQPKLLPPPPEPKAIR